MPSSVSERRSSRLSGSSKSSAKVQEFELNSDFLLRKNNKRIMENSTDDQGSDTESHFLPKPRSTANQKKKMKKTSKNETKEMKTEEAVEEIVAGRFYIPTLL